MEKDMKDPELERFMEGFRFKKPPEKIMSGYVSGVQARIDRGMPGLSFGLPLPVIGVSLIVLAGILFFILYVHPAAKHENPVPSLQLTSPTPVQMIKTATVQRQTLSVEEETAILEALGVDFTDEALHSFGVEELLEESDLLDELEMPSYGSAIPRG